MMLSAAVRAIREAGAQAHLLTQPTFGSAIVDSTNQTGARALSRSLAARHVTMISMGGIIGAGVFVGSSAAIAAVGPAIVLSYVIAGVLILLVPRILNYIIAIYLIVTGIIGLGFIK